MLLSPKNKNLTTIIMSRAKPEMFSESGYETKKDEVTKSDDSIALEAAASKAIQAAKSEDAAEFLIAIKSIFTILETEEQE